MEPQKLFTEYMRKMSQLYQDFSNDQISREDAVARLSVLKAEHKQLVELGIFPLNKRIATSERGDMIRKFNRARERAQSTQQPDHPLDFSCSCHRCVGFSTITASDREFLRELKITWDETPIVEEAVPKNF